MGARQAFYALLAAVAVVGFTVGVHSAAVQVDTTASVGRSTIESSDAAAPGQPQVAAAALNLIASKLDSTMSGLQSALGVVMRGAGITGARLDALTAPLLASTTNMLNKIEVVRGAYEKTLQGYLGLLLDNTKELRSTLEDGNAVIDIVRTLRGAECDAAKFEPPTAKPARITGPGGVLKVKSGSCSLKRVATPLKLDFNLECEEPGVSLEVKVPRYTSRFVTAAKASSEECKVTRKYGVESTTTVTLFNAADFFATAEGSAAAVEVDAADGASSNNTLGVNRAAGWASTLFPLLSKKGHHAKLVGGRVHFLPKGVTEAVQKAIRDATVDVTLNYKPFSLKADVFKAADSVAQALAASFEVKQQVYKVFKDELTTWGNADKRAELLQGTDFGANLRESMAALNMTSLFDGLFATTAGKLMAKTKLGGVLGSAAERPLRTLLSQVRQGAGQPVDVKLTASLADAASAASSLVSSSGLASVLSGERKGSLLERLAKDKGALGHLDQLQKLISDMAAASGVAGVAAPRAAASVQPATAQPQATSAAVEQPAADAAKPAAGAAAVQASDANGDNDGDGAGSP